MNPVLDRLGLVRNNGIISIFIPAVKRYLVFRVVSRRNSGFERIPYGPLPIPSGTVLYSLDGGTDTVPADGVMPGRSYTHTSFEIPPPESIRTNVFDQTDMWFLPSSYRDTLFHVRYYLKPDYIRMMPEIPVGVNTRKFQKDKVLLDINSDWGWSRGEYEMFRMPEIRVGWKFANDLNAKVYVRMDIVYGEYVVEIPKDPELIWEVIMGRKPAYEWIMPYFEGQGTVENSLIKDYGIVGFPPIYNKSQAVSEYSELIGGVKI